MATDGAPSEDFDLFDAVTLEDMRGRETAKWTYYPDDVLAAWVAEMDYPLAPVVRQGLHEAIDHGFTGYPPTVERTGLPAALAGWLSRYAGFVVEPDRIRIVPDVLRGMALAIETFSRPDSSVVILTPSYPPFFEVVRVVGRHIVEAPMIIHEGGRWTPDLLAIDAALRAGAGTVLLCNPHNPLGRVFTPEELTALAEVVEAHGARVVADELHAPLVYPGATYVPYASVSTPAAGHSVTLISASKGWNLPGLKCAQLLLTNAADVSVWDQLPFLKTSGASILGMQANRAAFAEGDTWREQVVEYLDGNRRLLSALLTELLPLVRYTPPEATYLAWLDCTALGLDQPAEFFLQHARVAVSDGDSFGAPGRGFVRLNFATSRALLTSIVQRMASSLS